MGSEVDDDDLNVNKWCYEDDLDKIMKMMCDLKSLGGDASFLEKTYEDFWQLLSHFQEQPQLLDGLLDKILNQLVDTVMDPKSHVMRIQAFRYLHTIMKVRGYKRVVRYMSHEVSYLEPVMAILESADFELECWQASHVLPVWMSILVLTPFPMSHFDAPAADGECKSTMISRIESLIKKNLMSKDKFSVATNLAANFYTRVDVKEKMLPPFFDWIITVIKKEGEQSFLKVSVMAAAADILKRGEREDLIEHSKSLLVVLLETSEADNQSVLYRKYKAKLIQQIGLTFLKKQKINWRYKKDSCSLLQNLMKNMEPASSGDSLMATNISVSSLSHQEQTTDEEQFEEDSLECLSEVIGSLIEALEDSDTVVRWSAAKGIGRITERLTQQMGGMVLTSVLDIFSDRKNHFSWHGACMALAQMASRGLLPKIRLTEIVEKVISALTFDEPRRFSSVGENVRDAACYVFWAFARAFNEQDLKPLSKLIMTNLLLVALFDREVHCRRAASAAFQEYVGRCSSDPNCIAIMNEADYMSVGIRSNAYLQVSVQVAKVGGFTKEMIEHLILKRLSHWDAVIRDLAAKTLNHLAPFEPVFIASFIPKLVEGAYGDALTLRLGATPAIAEIIHGLYVSGSLHDIVDDVTLQSVKNIIPNYRRDGYFRGIKGEMIKWSCSRYIEKCSEARLHVEDIADDWLFVIEDCVYNTDDETRNVAVNALYAFLENYTTEDISNKIVTKYVTVLSELEDGNFFRSCGAAVLGRLPKVVFEKYVDIIIRALIQCIKMSTETISFTDSRKMAIRALLYVITNTDLVSFSNDVVQEVFWCLLNSQDDFTRSDKGDVGSEVRCETVTALFALTKYVITNKVTMLTENIVEKMFPRLMQAVLESLTKVSSPAREMLRALLYSEPELPYIPGVDNLRKIFPRELCADEEWWKSNENVYPRFIEILLLLDPNYTHHVLMGFMAIVGGTIEYLMLTVSSFLFEMFEETPLEKTRVVAKEMVKVLAYSLTVEHLSVAALNCFTRLMDAGAMNNVLLDKDTTFATDLLNLLEKKTKYRDFNKMRAVICILTNISTVKGQVGLQAFKLLVRFLKHSSMAVRSFAATRMYETWSLIDEDIFPGCDMEVVMKLLAETKWKGSAGDYTDAVSKLCEEIATAMKL